MLRYLTALPYALPVAAVGAIVAAVIAKPVGRRLREHPVIVFFWMASVSVLIAATVTPSGHAPGLNDGLTTTRVWAWSFPAPGALFSVNWQSMNLLLFAPLGVASGLFLRFRHIVGAASIAALLSLAVELVQYMVIPLGRAQFNSATVVIGWVGIVVGMLVGRLVASQIRKTKQKGDQGQLQS